MQIFNTLVAAQNGRGRSNREGRKIRGGPDARLLCFVTHSTTAHVLDHQACRPDRNMRAVPGVSPHQLNAMMPRSSFVHGRVQPIRPLRADPVTGGMSRQIIIPK
ncbi:hypothetical protein [Thioalkalivibrio sp.]|uniref:hypothetical protein n=1 Tax=Thioalkalivibrio sp. TaxID=2093813 RepID=UPI00356880D8